MGRGRRIESPAGHPQLGMSVRLPDVPRAAQGMPTGISVLANSNGFDCGAACEVLLRGHRLSLFEDRFAVGPMCVVVRTSVPAGLPGRPR